MQRPIGVAVLAVAHFLIAVAYSYSLLRFVVVAMTIRQDNANQAAVDGIGPWREFAGGQPGLALGMVTGYVLIVLTMVVVVALAVVVGVGLWRLAIWARILGIAMWFVILIFSVFGLGFRLIHRGSLIRIAVAAAILLYLFRPQVKQAFGGAKA
jgi:hypothetical protein